MANFNRVVLCGNLVRKPETRYLQSGMAVGNFTIALNRKSKEKDEVSFIPITVWDKLAENCEKYLDKGSPVLLEGRLNQKSWTTKEGEKRTCLEVVAENVQFLGSNANAAGPDSQRVEDAKAIFESPAVDDVPF